MSDLLPFQFSEHTSENASTLASSDTIDYESFLMIFLLPFVRVNALAHLILSLALYLIHTCLLFMSLFLFWTHICSQVCIRSPIYPKLEGCHERKNADSRIEWNLRSFFLLLGKKAVGCRWVYTEAKSRWVIGSFEGPFGCQRVFLGVWNGLSGHFITGCKADVCADSCFFGCHSSLAPYQLNIKNVFLIVFLTRRFTLSNHSILLLRGS